MAASDDWMETQSSDGMQGMMYDADELYRYSDDECNDSPGLVNSQIGDGDDHSLPGDSNDVGDSEHESSEEYESANFTEPDECSDLEEANKRLRDEVLDLKGENKRLRDENQTLRSNVSSELMNIRRGQEAMVHAFSVYSGMTPNLLLDRTFSDTTLGAIEGIALKQIFVVGDSAVVDKASIDSVVAPMRFKAAGSFPHAVVAHKRTGIRQYEVEGRRQVIMKFRLVNKLNDSPVSEHLVRSDGMLPFKMVILYADNGQEVHRSDFDRLSIPSLTDPCIEHIDTRQMMNSEVVFKWDTFHARSSDTNPKARKFVVKVTPKLPDLAMHPDLTVTTPPFLVMSKVTAK